jgi:hypothetical protein
MTVFSVDDTQPIRVRAKPEPARPRWKRISTLSIAAAGGIAGTVRTTPPFGMAPVRLIRQAANKD